jgi:serine phosphatase RsbU (regulator of sigma subunit)
MAVGIYNRMRYIRKTNQKINKQKELITDSITYAQRIQSTILPSQELMEKLLPDHFVLFRPKDIVSGDFYWIKEVQDHLVIVGADCTGHGVPGAFMSMLGITMFNDLISDSCYDAPGAILDQLREKVKDMLLQQGNSDEQKDGMDLAIAILNKTTREIHFSGANNPLYIIRKKSVPEQKDLEPFASLENGDYRLFELKGDKQPIGTHWEETPFRTTSVYLKEQDSFYMFSDGYIDQFGGENRKKFKSMNFKKLLLSLQDERMDIQRQTLEQNFDQWKGPHEQIDDIIVLGVKV